MRHRAHALGDALLALRDDEIEAVLGGHAIAVLDDFAELPLTVDVQERERDGARPERLAGQVQQHRRVLADRVHEDGLAKGGSRLAQDPDRLRLEMIEDVVRADTGPEDVTGSDHERLLALMNPAEHRNIPRQEVSSSSAICASRYTFGSN